MEKQLIKELKHVHKIIQKKDKNKIQFKNINLKIILNFLEESNEEDIKIQFQTILEIINSIEDSTVQDSIKVKFIEKFKIDIDSIISQNINNNQQNFDIKDNMSVEKIIKVNS